MNVDMTPQTGTWALNYIPKPRKIFSNDKMMVVVWSDGTRTKTTCREDDTFDPRVGFAMCVTKKIFSNTKRAKYLSKIRKMEDHK
jgi:hypothetical protein